MAMILGHANGDATDNRIENLRIVCANCNATLETHCGRVVEDAVSGVGTFRVVRSVRRSDGMRLPRQRVVVLCPEDEIATLTDHDGDPLREPVIDPRWGLEQIIAHLAGFKAADITPFDVN